MTMITHDSISPQEWEWVKGLIDEVQRQEQRENFAQQLFQWDLAVKEFRKLEHKRFVLAEPDETDFRFHAMCLNAMLAIGHSLILQSRAFEKTELAQFNVTHQQIIAYVDDLEQSLREWHHGFSQKDITDAQAKIFGVSA